MGENESIVKRGNFIRKKISLNLYEKYKWDKMFNEYI